MQCTRTGTTSRHDSSHTFRDRLLNYPKVSGFESLAAHRGSVGTVGSINRGDSEIDVRSNSGLGSAVWFLPHELRQMDTASRGPYERRNGLPAPE